MPLDQRRAALEFVNIGASYRSSSPSRYLEDHRVKLIDVRVARADHEPAPSGTNRGVPAHTDGPRMHTDTDGRYTHPLEPRRSTTHPE